MNKTIILPSSGKHERTVEIISISSALFLCAISMKRNKPKYCHEKNEKSASKDLTEISQDISGSRRSQHANTG